MSTRRQRTIRKELKLPPGWTLTKVPNYWWKLHRPGAIFADFMQFSTKDQAIKYAVREAKKGAS